ncbi:hypothetical protein DPMN_148855 [Dreissena polymorpha]|uniref:Uncharacterized protein n=1 Tax=Dreissena polymorpha TaxID=45954 RepID=A0A9D4J1Y0_DREPO|nr:hypothetical protein DPMN_148855 [Dreissena polymorpha]
MCVNTSSTPASRTHFLIPQKQATELNTRNKTSIPILDYRCARHNYTEEVFEDLTRCLDYDKRVDIL